jgi:hypothetical protein
VINFGSAQENFLRASGFNMKICHALFLSQLDPGRQRLADVCRNPT